MDQCTVEGCERVHYGLGFCRLHYRRFKKHGDPGGVDLLWLPRDPVCSIDGCEKPHRSSGLCATHYSRLYKKGDPGPAALLIGRGDDIGYKQAHNRVRAAKGRASEHSCIDCGELAEHWSYIGGSAKERIGPENNGHGIHDMAYSPDPDDYEPRCIPCHRRHDLGR